MVNKVCRVCCKVKPLEAFYNKDNSCKECRKERQRARYHNPERVELNRVLRQQYSQEYRKRHGQRVNDVQTARLYGVSVDYASSRRTAYCEICGIHAKDTAKKTLVIDHDHDTGTVRGLLCDSCNTGIGRFKDRLDILRSAVLYLENNQKEF